MDRQRLRFPDEVEVVMFDSLAKEVIACLSMLMGLAMTLEVIKTIFSYKYLGKPSSFIATQKTNYKDN